MTPFFSIIVATYNADGVLSNLLNNLVAQTEKDFEVIIVDNCSYDNTLSIAHSFTDLLNLTIISEADDGTYDAINKGIGIATGQWIYNIGSDDTLYSIDTLALVKVFLQTTDAKMIYGSVETFRDNITIIYDGEFNKHKLLVKNICQQAAFYKTDLFNIFGLFTAKYKIWADWEYNLKLFNSFTPVYVPLIIAHFSSNGISGRMQDTLFIEDKIIQKYRINMP